MMDPSWILLSWIQPFCTKLWLKLIQSDWNSFTLTQLDDVRHLVFCHLGFRHFEQIKTSLIHSHSIWGCQPSWILHSSSQLFWTKKNFAHSFWLNMMMAAILNSTILDSTILHKKLHSFILTHLDDGCHLEFYHLGFSHFEQKKLQSFILTQLDNGSHLVVHYLEFGHFGIRHSSFTSETHSHLPRLVPTIYTQKTSLIHSDSTWWWLPSWFMPSWIQPWPFWIETPCYLLSDLLKNTLTPLWIWLKLIQPDSNSFILTQLDDVSHLAFCLLLVSHFEQKKTSLIHSDSTWWWLPSRILPSWIQPLPSWIETPCYLLSDSLKNTLTPLWLWLKLNQSD